MVNEALSSVSPFSKQLFIEKDFANTNLSVTKGDYTAPNAERVADKHFTKPSQHQVAEEIMKVAQAITRPEFEYIREAITMAAHEIGLICRVAITNECLSADALTASQRNTYDTLNFPERKQLWLRGRNALRMIDCEGINPHTSLTYCGELALAIRVVNAPKKLLRLG